MTARRPMVDMPVRCSHLPIDRRGYPVPKFVDWIDGEPDFRVMNPRHLAAAIKHKVCWICGEKLGRFLAFPIGPMCAINRITSEPPNHRECAEFAIKNCPFLSNPDAKRREHGLPDEKKGPGGIMIAHNPGATCLWITKTYEVVPITRRGAQGLLFHLGTPDAVSWWARGRPATRAEIEAAIEKGFPKLLETIALEDDPKSAERALWQARKVAEQYLPRD